MNPSTQNPLFIIGCPRSGTGVLHQTLRLHPDLSWITPLTNWVCGKRWFRYVPIPVARSMEKILLHAPNRLVPPFLRGPHDGSLRVPNLPETHEGHSIWNRFCQLDPHHGTDEGKATKEAISELRDVVEWHLRYHNRLHFVSKAPRHALRIRFLRAVFPEARFLHLVRDGRSVVASILARRRTDLGSEHEWWGDKPPGWQDHLSESPVKQAGWTWKTFLETIERDTEGLAETASYTITYEAFTHHPEKTLRSVFRWADIDPDRFLGSKCSMHLSGIRPARRKWTERLSSRQQTELEFISPLLDKYGYEPCPA